MAAHGPLFDQICAPAQGPERGPQHRSGAHDIALTMRGLTWAPPLALRCASGA